MIIKFHNRGVGRGSGPVDYLLGPDRQREGAHLDRGDPDQISALIDSSPYAKKYTSGVLSFHEADLSRESKDRLMTEFEQALLPGLDGDQYAVLWVEHRDKERLELNFVVPNVELLSGKRLQPYFHKADNPRLDAWRTAINGELGLHDPDDPINRQAVIAAKDLPKAKKEAAEAITAGLLNRAGAGLVRNREDVMEALTEAGFDIVRVTKNSVSIADPEGGRNIRLKGVLYEQDFRHGEGLRAELEAASERHRRETGERVRGARARYQKGVELKRAEHQRRYPRPAITDRLALGEKLGLDAGLRPVPAVSHERDLVVSGAVNRRALPHAGDLESPRGRIDDGHLWGRSEAVHPDGRGRGEIRGRLPDTEGVLNDGARAAVIERLRGIAERARATAERMAGGLQRLARHVREYAGGQQQLEARGSGLAPAIRELGQAGDALGRADQQLEGLKAQRRELARQHDRGRGYSM